MQTEIKSFSLKENPLKTYVSASVTLREDGHAGSGECYSEARVRTCKNNSSELQR